jgi:hypothetical protein
LVFLFTFHLRGVQMIAYAFLGLKLYHPWL